MIDKDPERQTGPKNDSDKFRKDLGEVLRVFLEQHPHPDDETAMYVLVSPQFEGDDGIVRCSPRQYVQAVLDGTSMGDQIVANLLDISTSLADPSGQIVIDDWREQLEDEERIALSQ